LDCKLENGNILRNGESFCLYDSQSGQGRDLVGSGHSLQRCDNGVLKPEFCDDRRKTICVQNEVPRNLIDPNDKNKQPSTFASCIPNDWQLCLAANSDNENCGVEDPKGVYNSLYGEGGPCKDLKKDNDQYNSCVNKLVCRKEACENQAVGYCYFNANVGLCAPSVPPGTLGIEEKYEELSDGNKIGFSFDPIMFFAEKSSLGGNPEWGEDCVAGCDVNTREFADRWNSYCKGLGDLGANYNVVGYYNKLGLFHNGPINNDYVDENDGYKHSKWINMMSSRLNLARKLLTEKGIIVIAVDHNELFNLGLLCDQVFREENRLGIVAVVHKSEGRNQEKFFGTSQRFIDQRSG